VDREAYGQLPAVSQNIAWDDCILVGARRPADVSVDSDDAAAAWRLSVLLDFVQAFTTMSTNRFGEQKLSLVKCNVCWCIFYLAWRHLRNNA
jgi:hypothetical protein